MSTSDPHIARQQVQNLHSSIMKAYSKGELSEVKRLLDKVANLIEKLEDRPFSLKERFWVAGFHQMQGEYAKAREKYEELINLANSMSFTDEESLLCLTSAFQNLVKIKGYSPDPPIQELSDIISDGLKWLVEKARKPEWSASLRLERGLIYKYRGDLKNARQEMEEALKLVLAFPDAPGYPLEIYQLEMAKLLCNTAVDSVDKELVTLRNTRPNRVAQKKIDQLQGQLRSEADRVTEGVNALSQAITTISNESIILKYIQPEHISRMQFRLSLPDAVIGDQQHVVCFVALPFEDDKKTFAYKTVLLPALRRALELEPYFWQVGRADDKYFAETIERNIFEWVARADVYMAEISDINPNVMMELGYMRWSREPEQPLIVLKRHDIHRHLADLAEMITIQYTSADGKNADKTIADELKVEFGKRSELLKLNTNKAHYLSPLIIQDKAIEVGVAEKLSREYKTMERFAVANPEDILNLAPNLTHAIAESLQDVVRNILKGPGNK